MKQNLLLLTASLALTAAAIPVRSFEAIEPTPPPPPEPIVEAVADAPAEVAREIEHARAEVARQVEHAHQQLANRRADVEAARARVGEAHAQVLELAQATQATTAASRAPAISRSTGTSVRLGGRHRGAGDAMVIRSSDPDAKAQAEMEEDLAVMVRVLDKAVAEQLGEDRRGRAMGINVFLSSAGSTPRAFYLEDYGAVFLLNVPLPLLPPPEKAEPAKEKPEADAAWEEARRELYGKEPFLDDVLGKALRFEVHGEAVPEYDAKKVDDLKEALLGALKNARNIRSLRPNDAITICVSGGPGGDVQRKSVVRVGEGDGDEKLETVTEEVAVFKGEGRATAGGSVLTLRVKKSDADAFAAGELDLPALEKRAKIALYAGGTGAAKGPWGLNLVQ